jgi:hypothetical protein
MRTSILSEIDSPEALHKLLKKRPSHYINTTHKAQHRTGNPGAVLCFITKRFKPLRKLYFRD